MYYYGLLHAFSVFHLSFGIWCLKLLKCYMFLSTHQSYAALSSVQNWLVYSSNTALLPQKEYKKIKSNNMSVNYNIYQ